MSDDDITLPTKPSGEFVSYCVAYSDGAWRGFDADDMESYARAAVLLDRQQRTPPAAPQGEADAYGYASRLAVAIWEKHYKDAAPQWKPLDDLMGVLTQIDNMSSGLSLAVPPAPSAEPPDHTAVMRQALSALDDYEVRYCELFAHAGLGDPTTDSVAVTIGRSAMDALRAALEPKQC